MRREKAKTASDEAAPALMRNAVKKPDNTSQKENSARIALTA